MRRATGILVGITWLASATHLQAAQFEEPPTITVLGAERKVRASVGADSSPEVDETLSTMAGPFASSAFMQRSGGKGSSGYAQAQQDSQISAFSIRGEGSVYGDASLGGGEGAKISVQANTGVSVSFTVPRDAPFTLSGRFTATGEAADGCRATGIVSIAGINADGFPIFVAQTFDCNDPPDQAEFFLTDTALADTMIAFAIEIEAYPEGGGSLDLLGEGAATFEFEIDFGDRDGDGLLDTWETEGIDIDGDDQLEIDLAGMGANPDVKDLFVEVDVMAGVSFDQSATDAVEYAFAQAPAWAVDNYDGSSGIQLHVVVDGDRPGNVALVLGPGEDLPADYYAIKNSYFGSEQDRIHPQWSEIWDVRLKIFRYCLWADTLAYSDGGGVYGLSEAVPSNDFVLAAGQMQSAPKFANVLSDAVAGLFMHELGHTLGLLHGGGPENVPEYKPNYLSVMNYAYSEPWDKITNQGTNAKEVWRLDYSRSALRTLEEGALLETEGLDGPSGRMILFNSSADGVPSGINIAWASASEVDWNFSGVIESDPYPLDVSNLLSRAASHDTLHSFTDWDRLWYHLSGDSHFDHKPWSFASSTQGGLDEDTVQAILDAEWVDQAALGNLIFENGFDLGSTTAWSGTVP